MNDFPLVSVGLPIYNRPDGLRRTLECFINQTYTNIEIIIADNCSPNPEVEKIAREYLEKDSRISYFRHEQNKGWGYNTVFVIEKAKGDFFLRATDDDWWDQSFIEEIMTLMIQNPAASLGFCDFIEVDQNGDKSKIHPSDHLSLLRQFCGENKLKKLINYINQFEGYGKADLYFSIFKTINLNNQFVKDLLLKQILAADFIINFYSLTLGELVLSNKMLLKVSFENEKLYDNKAILFNKTGYSLQQNLSKIANVYSKWNKYFFMYFDLISILSFSKIDKFKLRLTVYKRLVLLYLDLVLILFRKETQKKGILERKVTLE